MIKNLLAAAVLILTFSISYSQNCIPDGQYTTNGIHPDSATNFAPAYAGTPYSQLITVIIPQDTTVFPFPPIPWDSTVMVSMTGLPPDLLMPAGITALRPADVPGEEIPPVAASLPETLQ